DLEQVDDGGADLGEHRLGREARRARHLPRRCGHGQQRRPTDLGRGVLGQGPSDDVRRRRELEQHRLVAGRQLLSAADRDRDAAAATGGRRSGAWGTTVAAMRAMPPPMSASVHRPKAWPGLATRAAMTMPWTADCVTMTGPPSSRVAIAIDTSTTAAICHGPL